MKAFLTFGWQPSFQSIKKSVDYLCDRRTIFEGVQKILPGHYLTYTSFNSISQHKSWDVDYTDKVQGTIIPTLEANIPLRHCGSK
ncbi:predicted protein [Plenodomus lingam JN3]|uniref:Predicted protein n=1 Tax=Leptosphaeria maculans (strain JN3 / isolate v23.1.3 / race Av1-4-5-6-7-8) TaxID=985895 RepID=E5AEB4_LEPMJ|nr:predicted protein [Plenodomus lingam JN3]CBY01553.1 predicted protein [Plenodomus lingam JN3]